MTLPEVASEILAYCSTCKMDLYAVVVSIKKEKLSKVQCLTCKKEHAFKAPKGEMVEAPTQKSVTKAQELNQAIEAEWEKLMSAHKELPMRAYHMKTEFALGEKVKHTKFGEGIVERLIYPNKIEVIFRQDVKILIHAGKPYIFQEGQ